MPIGQITTPEIEQVGRPDGHTGSASQLEQNRPISAKQNGLSVHSGGAKLHAEPRVWRRARSREPEQRARIRPPLRTSATCHARHLCVAVDIWISYIK